MQPTLFEENDDRPIETLHPKISDHCEDFAHLRIANDAAFYARRRGGNPATPFTFWAATGAEFAASQYMTRAYGLPVVLPDTTIHPRNQKSFDEDLLYKNVNFMGTKYDELKVHVKSVQEGNTRHIFPESYMFSLLDEDGEGGTDPLLLSTENNNVLVLVCYNHKAINHDSPKFFIRGVVPWSYCKPLLENPKKPRLIGVKICLYTHTLLKHLPVSQAA